MTTHHRQFRTPSLPLALAAFLSTAALAADHLAFTNMTLLPNRQIQVQLSTVEGENYTIEISTNLVTWQMVGALEAVETNLVTLVDPEPTTAGTCRFYRARKGIEPIFNLHFMHMADGGHFGSGFIPSIAYPRTITSYSAFLDAEFAAPYPNASTVTFTGPAGSGLVNAPAGESWQTDAGAVYQSPHVNSPAIAPSGQWIVRYNGVDRVFTKPDPEAASRLVIPVPAVSVVGGMLRSVSWTYRAPGTGALLPGRPAFVVDIQMQIEGIGGRLFESGEIADPAITNASVSPAVSWASITTVNLAYDDTLGNHYVVFFRKP